MLLNISSHQGITHPAALKSGLNVTISLLIPSGKDFPSSRKRKKILFREVRKG